MKSSYYLGVIGLCIVIAVGSSQLNISDFIHGLVLGIDIVVMLYALYKTVATASTTKKQVETEEGEN
ncbi:MAG: hypothetical protein IKR14_04365 [Lachnospiraceae bacterium]|nr:hypothetical protein [Lachnospiraceae bacterium]